MQESQRTRQVLMSAAQGPREIHEAHNPSMGFFYTAEETLAEARTPYQHAELVRTEALGKVLLLDGITQVAERWEYRYHEPLVHPTLLAHPNPRKVLIIGGGDGGALRAVLLHRTVERVDFVELDEAVVRFSREHLDYVHGGAFDDPRVRLLFGDGRAFVERAEPVYDAVIMDMTDPAGPSRFLYTQEFFKAVASVLSGPEAVFSMHGESPAARPAAFGCISRTLRSVFPVVGVSSAFVPMYGTLWSFLYASTASDPAALSRSELEARMSERMAERPRLTAPALWAGLFGEDPLIAEAEADPRSRVITDAEPDFPDAF